MACKPGCNCKCQNNTCECWDGIQIRPYSPGDGKAKEAHPGLAGEKRYRCCGHCKTAYCPDAAGHYVPCPMECEPGHQEMAA